MYTLRYARALLEKKAKELGSHRAVATACGYVGRGAYNNYLRIRKGLGRVNDYRLGAKVETYLGVRPVTIYIPAGMDQEELELRLAIGRRGNAA